MLCASHHDSEADSAHCVHIFPRNHMFNDSINRRQKYHSPIFMCSFSAVFDSAFLVTFPIDQVIVFKHHDIDSPSYSFMMFARQRLWDVR